MQGLGYHVDYVDYVDIQLISSENKFQNNPCRIDVRACNLVQGGGGEGASELDPG